MKKLAALVAGGLLLCGGVGVATAGSRCELFEGRLTLTPLDNCEDFKAIKKKERIFEDAVFLFDVLPSGTPNICFSGAISGATLGGRPVEAESLSAFTVNNFQELLLLTPESFRPNPPVPAFTAATVVKVTADREPRKDKKLGQIFLRDSGVLLPDTTFAVEQLIGVGGTGKFANATASIDIVGYELEEAQKQLGLPPAEFKGTICR